MCSPFSPAAARPRESGAACRPWRKTPDIRGAAAPNRPFHRDRTRRGRAAPPFRSPHRRYTARRPRNISTQPVRRFFLAVGAADDLRIKAERARRGPERRGVAVAVAAAGRVHRERFLRCPADVAGLVVMAAQIGEAVADIKIHRAQHLVARHGIVGRLAQRGENVAVKLGVAGGIASGTVKKSEPE